MAGSGVYRLRNSRKAPKTMPRVFHSIVDTSGLRGTDVRHVSVDMTGDSGLAPAKHRPFAEYPTTKPPKSAEQGHDGEGKIRGRQADKSSKSK